MRRSQTKGRDRVEWQKKLLWGEVQHGSPKGYKKDPLQDKFKETNQWEQRGFFILPFLCFNFLLKDNIYVKKSAQCFAQL